MEKGLFIPHFLGGKSTIFGNVTKNGYVYVAIFGNVTKNGYVTKMTTVCPTVLPLRKKIHLEWIRLREIRNETSVFPLIYWFFNMLSW